MKKAITLIIAASLFIGGCMRMRELTKEEAAYVEKAMKHPLIFSVPNSISDAAWGRAQAFVGNYSSMKIQIASDYVLQTYNAGSYGQFSYNLVRSPKGNDSTEFRIDGGYMGVGLKDICIRNLHICAYHVGTGEPVMSTVVYQ